MPFQDSMVEKKKGEKDVAFDAFTYLGETAMADKDT
jgi:hypothetical protein